MAVASPMHVFQHRVSVHVNFIIRDKCFLIFSRNIQVAGQQETLCRLMK